MTSARRAPELSAILRIVSCCTMAGAPLLGPQDDLGDPPAHGLGERPGFHDADRVAQARAELVARLDLLAPGDLLRVDRVRETPGQDDRDRPGHPVAGDDPRAGLSLRSRLAGRLGHGRSHKGLSAIACRPASRAAPSVSAQYPCAASGTASGCRSPRWPSGSGFGTPPPGSRRASSPAARPTAPGARSPAWSVSRHTSWRRTNRVRTGSLAAASANALRASSSVTPSASKRIRAGLTPATHPSGLPLPFPIRVSAGFLVIGLSGKIRIQTLPPRFISRVIATREASICRLVTQPGSRLIRPYSPNAIVFPRVAIPRVFPLNIFRNLTRLGASIGQAPVL